MGASVESSDTAGSSPKGVRLPSTGEAVRRVRPSQDLVEYLDEFGLSLADLQPEQVGMFLAARGAARHVEDLEIPIAPRPTDPSGTTLTERETENVLDLTAYSSDPTEIGLPADEMDVTTIRSTEDLPRIFPSQWLLEETWPEAFYAKLAQRELLMPQWQTPNRSPHDAWDDVQDRELVQQQAESPSPKQHAYVLLDTSRTMNDHDRRGAVARGLALAFLLHGHRQRSRLNFRPFTAKVGELSAGVGRDEFRTLVERVIEIPNSGQTKIQDAVEQAVLDIRGAGPCLRADIMLITDGISRLKKCPLADEKLHTFIVGDLFEENETAGTINTLKQWSETFRRVWKNRFAEILAPTPGDLRAAGRSLDAEQLTARDSQQGVDRLRRMIASTRSLLEQFKRSLEKGSPLPPEARELQKQLRDAEQMVAGSAEQEQQTDGRPMPTAGRSAMSMTARLSMAGDGTPDPIGFWEYLKYVTRRAWRWVCGVCRRLRRLVGAAWTRRRND